ncbi:helix-turn-helix transcriptional regulator [Mycobacterium mantenii]|uniref:Uncharacterized protein n=1 Tax=Mycobacterium mantenii TaxID=560555 RepID=A0A1A2T9S6_MYCNT|nr:helix-turn-helix transcriptional regulator [Mycobacterium mantenii]OBH47308.1 hypothetical protein A5688_03120 [Mycobacterium mantenii]OBH73131.1 hypothetical protein A5683_25260 [Mycobacterium mantenii]
MASRSAADTVVMTDAFRNVLHQQREKLNADGKERRPGDAPLSRARLAAQIENCDPSTVAKWENGPTKQIARETVEQLAVFELPDDEGRLYVALGILPKTAEKKLSVYRRAVGSNGLPITIDTVRRIEAELIAEEVYARDPSPPPIPVPDHVLARIGQINRPFFVPPSDMGPNTPLVAFTSKPVHNQPPERVDVRIALPAAASPAVYQFALAHAAAHRLLGKDRCQFLPALSSSLRAFGAISNLPEVEVMANNVAIRLLAPQEAVRRAHDEAVVAIARADEQADFWAIGLPEVAGEASPEWVDIVTRVATQLNVPGWLACRRLVEEGLMDLPPITGWGR